MKLRKIVCLSFFSTLLFFNPSRAADAPSEAYVNGEKLFLDNCASCHKPLKKVIGPALKGVEQRWTEAGDYNSVPGKEWLYRWIRNSPETIKSGNPYAIKMAAFDAQVMTTFAQLTDQDIANVLTYVETYTPPVVIDDGGGNQKPAESPYTSLFLYSLIALLLFIVLILSRLTSILNRMALQKQGLPAPELVPFHRNKKVFVTIGLVLFIYIGYATVVGAIDLGRQQGYMPEQPIKYSHELHAGINQINCRYCHGGTLRGKQANIPSPNVCMNCHKGIKGDEPTRNAKHGRKEISKIYASIGFDPNTLSYIKDYHKMDEDSAKKLYTDWLKGDEKRKYTQPDIDEVLSFIGKPIEWVRIHNLPDHVYFNHSQHVVTGNIECQTCHGPVEKMEKLYQFSPLSMGWCINCHRTTPVNFAKNNFYEDYRQLHEDLKSGKIDSVTVETIGGTECQKCHY